MSRPLTAVPTRIALTERAARLVSGRVMRIFKTTRFLESLTTSSYGPKVAILCRLAPLETTPVALRSSALTTTSLLGSQLVLTAGSTQRTLKCFS